MISVSQGYSIYTDGGSRGNPGPAAYGFVVYDATGEKIHEANAYIGITTNNQAEYQGIAAALGWLRAMHPTEPVVCYLDSQLVVRQITGVYRLKQEALRPWLDQVREHVRNIDTTVSFRDIPREQNRYADKLVNDALDGEERGSL